MLPAVPPRSSLRQSWEFEVNVLHTYQVYFECFAAILLFTLSRTMVYICVHLLISSSPSGGLEGHMSIRLQRALLLSLSFFTK